MQEHDLESFDYDRELVANFATGTFPDVILKTNGNNPLFPGGEFIEFKNTQSYSIASFNSTIPTGTKPFGSLSKKRKEHLRLAGFDSHDDEMRSVYYLIRGRIPDAKPFPVSKVCLVHGSFFETISASELIKRAFQQILSEFSTLNLDQAVLTRLPTQDDFAKTRNLDSSAVKIRFRVMTEAASKANLLRQNFYPLVKDNTLSLVVPLGSDEDVNPNHELVAPDHLQRALSPMNSLREAFNSYRTPLVWDDILVGTIRHPVDCSNWFIAQTSFHIDQSVKR